MISAQNQRRHSLFEALDDGLGGAGAGIGDLMQEARIGAAGVLGLSDLDANIAAVGDLVAESFQPRPITRILRVGSDCKPPCENCD